MKIKDTVIGKNIFILFRDILFVLECFWSPSHCRKSSSDGIVLLVIPMWLILPFVLLHIFGKLGGCVFLGILFFKYMTREQPEEEKTESPRWMSDAFEAPDALRKYEEKTGE